MKTKPGVRNKVEQSLRKMLGRAPGSDEVTRVIQLAKGLRTITQADEENGLGSKTVGTVSILLKEEGSC